MVLIKLYETLLQENQWRGTNIVLQTKSSEGLTFIYRFLPSPKEKEGGGVPRILQGSPGFQGDMDGRSIVAKGVKIEGEEFKNWVFLLSHSLPLPFNIPPLTLSLQRFY